MEEEQFYALCLIAMSSWRFHPGWFKEGPYKGPSWAAIEEEAAIALEHFRSFKDGDSA